MLIQEELDMLKWNNYSLVHRLVDLGNVGSV